MLWQLLALAPALLGGATAGYILRVGIDRRQQREREAVLDALGGAPPQHERVARALEAAAIQYAQRGSTIESRSLLDQAANVRARGGGTAK